MTAKELKKILNKVPDTAQVFGGEEKFDGNCSYNVRLNIVDLGPRHAVVGEDIDLCKTKRELPYLSWFWLDIANRMATKGSEIAHNKKDGKAHRVRVIFSQWDEYLFGSKLKRHEWISLVVDDTREDGGKLGVGKQWVVCDFQERAGWE